MPETKHVTPRNNDILLLVGTMKGAFVLRANESRTKWDVGGPYFPGSAVYAMAYDGRAGRHRIWAGPHSMHWGALLRSTDDFGKSWTNPEAANVKFPESAGAALERVWQIVPGRESEPETLYCGVEPAAVFTSKDAGETWQLNEGLWNHPQRAKWVPGGGGMCLHTILLHPSDPQRIRIAVSTAGMYVTDDGGATWRPSNEGVRAEFLPDKYPEFGQCVHKVVQSKQKPERMYLQNHWGLYRSDDRGGIVPLESDGFRCTPGGKLRVYHTTNAGKKWKPLTKGLPQEDAFETVLRDAMAADALDPAGIYFGTRSGKLFASASEGKKWSTVIDGLPPIVSVKVAQV